MRLVAAEFAIIVITTDRTLFLELDIVGRIGHKFGIARRSGKTRSIALLRNSSALVMYARTRVDLIRSVTRVILPVENIA